MLITINNNIWLAVSTIKERDKRKKKGFLHKINVTHEVNEKYKGERSVVLSNPQF